MSATYLSLTVSTKAGCKVDLHRPCSLNIVTQTGIGIVDITQISFAAVFIGELGEASVVDWCVVGRDTGRSAYQGRFGLGWPWLLSTAGDVNRPRRETGQHGWRVVVHQGRYQQAEIVDSSSTAGGAEGCRLL